jgi:hypothetical protein
MLNQITQRMECPPNMTFSSAADAHLVYIFDRHITRADQPTTQPLLVNGTLFRAHFGVAWDVFGNCRAVFEDGNELKEDAGAKDVRDGAHIAVMLRGISILSSLFSPPLGQTPTVSDSGPYDPAKLAALCPTIGAHAATRKPKQLVCDFIRVLGRSVHQGLGKLRTYKPEARRAPLGYEAALGETNVIGVARPEEQLLVIYPQRALRAMELSTPLVGGMLQVDPHVLLKCLLATKTARYGVAGGASAVPHGPSRLLDDKWVLCGSRMLELAEEGRVLSTVSREREEYSQAILFLQRIMRMRIH